MATVAHSQADERLDDQVIVLVAAPGKAQIDDSVIAEAVSTVSLLFANPEVRWLDETGREACEIAFTPPPASHYNPRSLEERLRARLMGLAIDVAVLPLAGRRKKLLIADMDSTIIGQECIDELAAEAGVGDEVAEITERAMRGELGFREALKERVRQLKGLPQEAIDRVIVGRICINPGAETLVRTMKAHGAYTALVSGGFEPFAEHVAKVTGFDCFQANRLPCENGVLTGETAEPILGRDAKLEALERLVKKLGIDFADALAVGDGANDAAMVERAGLGVAYHAKPLLRQVADVRIDHGDLTALLYIQGYKKEEFVEP